MASFGALSPLSMNHPVTTFDFFPIPMTMFTWKWILPNLFGLVYLARADFNPSLMSSCNRAWFFILYPRDLRNRAFAADFPGLRR